MWRILCIAPAVTWALCCQAAGSQELTQARPGEVLIGPVPFNQTVQGVTISPVASVFISTQPEGGQQQVTARVVVDLDDLQRKTGALVGTIALPADNCARFSADNVVVRLSGEDLTIQGDAAVLTVHGNGDLWWCLDNPFDHGHPAKGTVVQNQSFTATVPFRLTTPDTHTLAVVLGNPTVDLGGDHAELTNEVLRLVGVDLGGRLKAALDSAVGPQLLKSSLPDALAQLHPTISNARFLANAGALAATVELNAQVDAQTLVGLLASLQNGLQGH